MAPRGHRSPTFHFQSLSVLVFVPWCVFLGMASVTGLLHSYSPLSTFIVATLFMAFAAFLAVVNLYNPHGPLYLYLAILSVISISCGWMAGMNINNRFMAQYWAPVLRPSLDAVSAMSPPAAIADAGTLLFSASARLDLNRVLGRRSQEDGETYCVAPILSDAESTEANIWAAGVGCCGHGWSFRCDDAGVLGASTGLVLFDPDWQLQQFRRSAVQAAAFYGLHLPPRPVFVRWVKNVNDARSTNLVGAIIMLLVECCVYFLTLIVVASILHYGSAQRVIRTAVKAEGARELQGGPLPFYGAAGTAP